MKRHKCKCGLDFKNELSLERHIAFLKPSEPKTTKLTPCVSQVDIQKWISDVDVWKNNHSKIV